MRRSAAGTIGATPGMTSLSTDTARLSASWALDERSSLNVVYLEERTDAAGGVYYRSHSTNLCTRGAIDGAPLMRSVLLYATLVLAVGVARAQTAEIAASVIDEGGQPVEDAVVLAVPTGRTRY
jgi:hypothetical protein